MPAALATPVKIVWTRRQVVTDVCPKSLITAESLGWIEEFLIWKRLRLDLRTDLSARQAEAFLILEDQLALEEHHGSE